MKSAMPNIDLNPHDWVEVASILKRHVPTLEVWAFGSRVRWTAKSHSDLDIALITHEPFTIEKMAEIKEAFDDSSLSIRVDVVDWFATSDSFKKIIKKNKIVIQDPSSSACAGSTWIPYRISEIGKVVTGKTPSTSNPDFRGVDVPFVTPPDFIGNKWITKTARSISEGGAQSVKNNIIPAHAVLVTCIGSDMGKTAIVSKRSVTNQQINAIIVDEKKFSPEFIFYNLFLRQTEIKQLAGGSAQPILNKSAFSEIWIDCPSLDEQKRIADLLRPLDDRIALLRETNATLEAIAQALFKSWFVDFDPVRAKQQGIAPEGMDAATAALFPDSFEESELGLVPSGWRVGRVADIGEVICGKTPPTSEPANYGDDVPFITIPDMHDLLTITSTKRLLSILGANTQKKKTLPSGSICVSCIATAGLVARVTTPSQTNQQINSVVPFPKWGNSFPLFTLRRIGDAVRAGGSGGSVFHNLNKSGFEQLKVLFPSERLALTFNEIVEQIIEKIISNQKQAQTLTTLRDTLLPRLISGQLRLPEAASLLAQAAA